MEHIPPNDISHILNKLILKLILKLFAILITAKTEKKLNHHNIGFALHSGFNATEKKTTITV